MERRNFRSGVPGGAVRIVRETGKPIVRVARELGLHQGTLGRWVNLDRHARDGEGPLSESERTRRPDLMPLLPRTGAIGTIGDGVESPEDPGSRELARALERAITREQEQPGWLQSRGAAAAHFVRDRYTAERERTDVLAATKPEVV